MPIRYLPFLRLATLGFLSAPWFIFMVTWMRPAWAVACVLMFVAVIYAYGRQSRASTMPELADDLLPTRERIPVGTLMLLLAVAVAWVSVSGAGGVGLQNLPDWNNKNVLMRDLLDKPWPVVYEGGLILNYYFALYLPASLVGRLAGWDAAQWFMYGEVLVGTVLALLWVYSFSGRLGVKVLLLFIAFGGLDLIGYRLAWHRMPTWGKSIEWWVSTLQFSSNSTLLYWVPQHCLSGWLLTALMLDEASRMRRVAFIGLFLGLCALWSPFVTIGLAPIALLVIYLAKGKSLGSFANFVFLPVVAILMYALYAPHKAGSDVDAGLAVWARHYSPSSMFRTFVFLTLEIGVYLALVATCWKSLDRSWRAIAVTVAVSSLLWVLAPEEVGHGGFNMRASIPTLLLLCLLVSQTLSLTGHRLARIAMVGCLLIGSAAAVQETIRSFQRYPEHIPAPRPTYGVLALGKRHTGEFIMPIDAPLYGVFYRTPAVPDSTAGR